MSHVAAPLMVRGVKDANGDFMIRGLFNSVALPRLMSFMSFLLPDYSLCPSTAVVLGSKYT